MNKDEKAAVVDRIAGELERSQAVFAVDFRGITVTQIAELRSRLREADTTFSVVKNSLTERAADKAGVEGLKAVLEGPTALAFVRGDAAAAAKALSAAQRETQVLEFKGGLLDGRAIGPDDIKAIAKLPTRDALYGQLVGLVASPLGGLVRSLNGLLSGLAIQLRAIHDQGLVPAAGAGGDAGSADAEPGAADASAGDGAGEAPAGEAEAAPDASTDTDQTEAAAEAGDGSDAKED